MKRGLILFLLLFSFAAEARHVAKPKGTTPDNAPDTTLDAKTAKTIFQGMIDDVNAGIQMVHAEALSTMGGSNFPVQLDTQADGACSRCFGAVLGEAVSDPKWVKKGNTYTYTDGDFVGEFSYDPTEGKIEINK